MVAVRVALIAIALVCWMFPVSTAADYIAATAYQNHDYTSPDFNIKNNVIQETPPSGLLLPVHSAEQPKKSTVSPSKPKSNGHRIQTETQISEADLRAWLSERNSPLAANALQISQSRYWSTIIGICWIEQHHCGQAPSFNYWGLMGKTGLQKFPNMESAIAAIDNFLAAHESNHPTIESMRGWYCASACTNWEPTVIKIKVELENLKN